MRPYKAVQDITRDDTWYAMVHEKGHWETVRDPDGAVASFKTWLAAINVARMRTIRYVVSP